MKNSKKIIILRTALAGLGMLLTFAAAPARAAAPELISFQGKLTDSANKAVTSVVSMVFKLYAAGTGGAAVWTENQNVTPDENGIYNVLLGTVTPLNISFSTAYWLGVKVGSDAEMTPRYQLVSSAYSLYAVNSGTAAWAAGADWSGILNKPALGTGDVLLASTQTFTGKNTFSYGVYFSSTIQSAGSVGVEGLYGPGVSGNSRGANAVDLQVYRDNAAQVASGDISVIGGGMGNTASNLNATVAGGANNTASGGGATVSGGGSNTASGLNDTVAGGNTNTASGQFSTVSGGADNTANGIAVTVSGGQFNNASGQYSIAAGGSFNTASGDYSFAAGKASSSTAAGTFTWADSQIGGGEVLNNVADRTWFKNRGGFLISTATTASAAAFAVDSTGNVGIGTAVPGAKLEVAGQVKITGGAPGAGKVLTSDANGLAAWATAATGALAIGGSYGGGKIFWLDASGRHGLIAAIGDQSTGVQWNDSGLAIGATLNAVYAGKADTAMIISTPGTGGYAAKVCSDYAVTVNNEYYDDWYLPSTYELLLLYAQRGVVGDLANSWYWSSRENNALSAWFVDFNDGTSGSVTKSDTFYVRCVRAGP